MFGSRTNKLGKKGQAEFRKELIYLLTAGYEAKGTPMFQRGPLSEIGPTRVNRLEMWCALMAEHLQRWIEENFEGYTDIASIEVDAEVAVQNWGVLHGADIEEILKYRSRISDSLGQCSGDQLAIPAKDPASAKRLFANLGIPEEEFGYFLTMAAGIRGELAFFEKFAERWTNS